MYRNSLVLVLLISIFQCSFSKTITVYRNAGSTGGDKVENRGCSQNDCTIHGLTCSSEGCCYCECPSLKPNYIVFRGECKSDDEVKQELNSDCKFELPSTSGNPRLPDLPLTTKVSGEKNFSNHVNDLDVLCNHTIVAKTWEKLTSLGTWQKGVGDVFSIGYYEKQIGGIFNDYRIQTLKWSNKLHNDYTGTIIKIAITCGSEELGCMLAKVTGQKTYDTTRAEPPPTIAPPRTTTRRTVATTTITVEPRTTPAKNTSETGRQKVNNNPDDSNPALAPILAPIGGLLAIALLIGAILVYRRGLKRTRDPENDKDPIYAEVNKGFENGVYNDPTMDVTNLRSHLGPLPFIPGTESPYQSLNDTTRKDKDYDNLTDGCPPEADYDNPPTSSPEKKESADYDNPPTQEPQGNSSDYDNPPPVEDGDGEKPDYDVPPNHAKDSGSSEQDGSDHEDTAF